MSIMRVHKTSNFTIMSNYHFKEKKMSLKAKGLLSLMLSLPDDWNYSISGLVKLSKDGKDSVMSALSELEKFGYLTRVKIVNEKGQFAGIEYNIYEKPQEELPPADYPILDKEKAAKQDAGKPPQLNTNNSNTNENKVLYDINNYIPLLDTVPNSRLRNLYCDFIDSRFRMGSPITVKGFELLLERVRELAGIDVDRQIELVKQAVINGWKNVYANVETPTTPELDELKNFYS